MSQWNFPDTETQKSSLLSHAILKEMKRKFYIHLVIKRKNKKTILETTIPVEGIKKGE